MSETRHREASDPQEFRRSLRLALVMDLAPRKLGTLEGWLVEFANQARQRGHELDVFGRQPIHPTVSRLLSNLSVGWHLVDTLEQHPIRAIRRLSRNYDILHLNLFAPRSRMAILAYMAWPARVCFVDRISGTAKDSRDQLPFHTKFVDRFTMARVASFAGISEYVTARAVDRFGLAPGEVRTIHNGVDLRRFPPSPERTPAGEPVVTTVANLIPEKGVHHLLRAFASLRQPGVHLKVVGDGPEAGTLKELARSLGIAERTEFLGLRNDVPEILTTTDIFVHPAVWAEAWGNTVTEAMASGCAVIASDVGGIPEMITDRHSGVLVPPGDESALAQALSSLLDDPEQRARLGANARRIVEERFSIRLCVQRHLDWCEEIAALG